MSTGRKVLLVLGILLALPALGLMASGVGVAAVYGIAKDDDGYLATTLDPVRSQAAAVTTSDLDFGTDPGPTRLLDRLDVRFRVTARAIDPSRRLFVGIGPTADVRRYLRTVRTDRVVDLSNSGRLEFRRRPGTASATPPGDETFWIRRASGVAPTVTWLPESGRWTVVVMNADGGPDVSTRLRAGVKASVLVPAALVLFGLGLLLAAVAVVMVVVAAHTPRPAPAVGEVGAYHPGDEREPVALVGERDAQLSRGLWLVKWFLAVPHYIVLFFLWAAFWLLTIVAGFAILFTGRYPHGIFHFNVGVLRWTWRVSFYAGQGGLGTDRYPPFTLADVPDYPAHLEIAYPEHLSRGLVLVKWWLLAIPHYLVLAAIGGTYGDRTDAPSLLVVLVVIAGGALLFTGRYPGRLFDLIVGINRWFFRVIAYAALMTDRYPPFRLDQGPHEPAPEPHPGPDGSPQFEAAGTGAAPVPPPPTGTDPAPDRS